MRTRFGSGSTWATLALVCVGIGVGVRTGVAAATEPAGPRTISVSGRGEVSRAPDLAVVSFAVETTGDTAALAGESNASKSAAVAKSVETKLDEKDRMRTTGYSLQPIYEPRERGGTGGGEPKIRGYIARNEVRVEMHSMQDVGKLIDVAIAAGANRVNGVEFTLEDRSAAESEALREAGQNAKMEAQTVAAALGVQIGAVQHATTVDGPMWQPRRYQAMAMAAESRATTPIEAGDVKVTATLQVTYTIE